MAGVKKKLGPRVPTGPAMPSMVEMDKPRKPHSSVSVRLDSAHAKMMPNARVGKKHRMSVIGKITGMRSDEYGHSIDLDIDKLEHESPGDSAPEDAEPRSLTHAMKRRNRHMRSGRYTA